tara:strand:- start:1435 stop:2142 length:708 start_codon:yes stop_codon:yes gene_type:complete
MTTFISAPFGNYLKFKNAVSVTGTWTYKPRPGLLKQIIKTLRYTRNGWRNKIGLRNRGIEYGIQHTNFNEVLSIAAIDQYDWINLESIVPESQSVELNISCPNLDVHQDTTDFKGFDLWSTKKRKWCIVKVPPTSSYNLLDKIVDMGFTQIHASNTLPTDKGGLSGPILLPHTRKIITYLKSQYKNIEVIAGGGIKEAWHAEYYKDLGADHVSIGTGCFNPLKTWRTVNDITLQI